MREFKVGDVVTDVILGKTGKVTSNEDKCNYPIEVHFEDGFSEAYLLDGRKLKSDKIASLYHGEVTIEIKQPVYEYQVIYMNAGGHYRMTDWYASDKAQFDDVFESTSEFIELYQPSKRIRK